MNDTITITEQLKERYGSDAAQKMLSYIDLVLERNEHINLTAVRDRDEAIVKHLADSLAVTGLPEYKAAERIIDVGTGAGFPGALLAIASTDKDFVLLDSTLKRLRVIDEFAEKLQITNIRTVHARAEELSRKPEFRGSFDLCVSRAVAGLSRLSGWCLPFVRSGGYFISYKGENYAKELDETEGALKKLGGRLERVEEYADCPADISGHVLLVIRKK